MNKEDQKRAVVAGLIHALQKSSDLRRDWAEAYNGTSDDFITFLNKLFTFGKTESLTKSDLKDMSDHANNYLASQLNDLKYIDPTITTTCICNGLDRGLPPKPKTS